MERFLKHDMDINISAANGLCANMGLDFVEKSTNKDTVSSDLAQKTLIEFFKVLKNVNAEFGYRSVTQKLEIDYDTPQQTIFLVSTF